MAKATNNGYFGGLVPTLQWYEANPNGGDANRTGASTGLVLTHACNELLYATNGSNAAVSDEEIAAALAAEFSNRPTLQSVAAYRAYFNAGKHGFGYGSPLPVEQRLRKYKPAKPAPPAPAAKPAPAPQPAKAAKGGKPAKGAK